MEKIIILTIVFVSIVLLIRNITRTIKGKDSCCGCGDSKGCGEDKTCS